MKENVNSLTWTRVCCENEMWREWERTWTRVVLWEPQRDEARGRRGHEFSDVNQSRSVRTITRCGVGKNLGIRFKLHDMVEENVIALTWNGMRRENWKTLGITCCQRIWWLCRYHEWMRNEEEPCTRVHTVLAQHKSDLLVQDGLSSASIGHQFLQTTPMNL